MEVVNQVENFEDKEFEFDCSYCQSTILTQIKEGKADGTFRDYFCPVCSHRNMIPLRDIPDMVWRLQWNQDIENRVKKYFALKDKRCKNSRFWRLWYWIEELFNPTPGL